ncbi:MAG: DEAD/DEAH box helicase family protein [bacterium]
MKTPLQQLYDYQRDAVNKTHYNPKGIICMPTSTGKSFTMSAILTQDILMNKGQFRIYVVNAPRILLSYQLMKEFYSFLLMTGIEARYMFVHSGGKANDKELEEIRLRANSEGHAIPYSSIHSATQVAAIRDSIETAHEMSLPIVLFSTYNSAQNIQYAINTSKELKKSVISMVLNDEAHYLVQEQFHDILNTLNASRCYFFTATTIHTPSDKGRGMNNADAYGEVLYEMIPADAIKLGKMVRPRMHFVRTDGVYNSEDYEKS